MTTKMYSQRKGNHNNNNEKIDNNNNNKERLSAVVVSNVHLSPSLFRKLVVELVLVVVLVTLHSVYATTTNMDEQQDLLTNKKKIAVIGGSITGSFVTKYLSDYDVQCTIIDTITIFEPYPEYHTNPIVPLSSTNNHENNNNNNNQQQEKKQPPSRRIQGSRIRTLELQDGSIVELGASIGYNGFYHVLEMIRNDENIVLTKPMSTEGKGPKKQDDDQESIKDVDGLGIYDGTNRWPFVTSEKVSSSSTTKPSSSSSSSPKSLTYLEKFVSYLIKSNETTAIEMIMRYNVDLYKASKVCDQFLMKWSNLPTLLNLTATTTPTSTTPTSTTSPTSSKKQLYYNNPDEVWDAIGLINAVRVSFDQLLDVIGVTSSKASKQSYFQSFIVYLLGNTAGALRDELLTGLNLVNYNQNNEQMNGIGGMGSLAAAMNSEHIFSIKGGNYQVIQSAFQQAKKKRKTFCSNQNVDNGNNSIIHDTSIVTTIIGKLEGFTLYSDGNILGEYDIVIIAAPIQQTRITFLIHSSSDSSVLQPMPLNGLFNVHNDSDSNNEDSKNDYVHHNEMGRDTLPPPLPKSAIVPYKQVITTIVSHATLNMDSMSFPHDIHELPRSIFTTVQGKSEFHNITSISYLKDGLYKLFSNDLLELRLLQTLFGSDVVVEYEHIWGGPFGGATPNYFLGKGPTCNFLLYDGSTGFEGHTNSGGLYYPNSMEQSSLASMEISAVGAKVVANLIAKRLNMIPTKIVPTIVHDEL